MTVKECINRNGITTDCNITGSRRGVYEIQFENTDTGEDDFTIFEVVGAGTNDGNLKCEALFKDFCKTEGISSSRVIAVHITSVSM